MPGTFTAGTGSIGRPVDREVGPPGPTVGSGAGLAVAILGAGRWLCAAVGWWVVQPVMIRTRAATTQYAAPPLLTTQSSVLGTGGRSGVRTDPTGRGCDRPYAIRRPMRANTS